MTPVVRSANVMDSLALIPGKELEWFQLATFHLVGLIFIEHLLCRKDRILII
jgi:hypothetical protein